MLKKINNPAWGIVIINALKSRNRGHPIYISCSIFCCHDKFQNILTILFSIISRIPYSRCIINRNRWRRKRCINLVRISFICVETSWIIKDARWIETPIIWSGNLVSSVRKRNKIIIWLIGGNIYEINIILLLIIYNCSLGISSNAPGIEVPSQSNPTGLLTYLNSWPIVELNFKIKSTSSRNGENWNR